MDNFIAVTSSNSIQEAAENTPPVGNEKEAAEPNSSTDATILEEEIESPTLPPTGGPVPSSDAPKEPHVVASATPTSLIISSVFPLPESSTNDPSYDRDDTFALADMDPDIGNNVATKELDVLNNPPSPVIYTLDGLVQDTNITSQPMEDRFSDFIRPVINQFTAVEEDVYGTTPATIINSKRIDGAEGHDLETVLRSDERKPFVLEDPSPTIPITSALPWVVPPLAAAAPEETVYSAESSAQVSLPLAEDAVDTKGIDASAMPQSEELSVETRLQSVPLRKCTEEVKVPITLSTKWKVRIYARVIAITPIVSAWTELSDRFNRETPTLLISRTSTSMFETHSDKAYLKAHSFEKEITVDAILGILHIKGYRFLVCAAHSYAVCALHHKDKIRFIYTVVKPIFLPLSPPSTVVCDIIYKTPSMLDSKLVSTANHSANSNTIGSAASRPPTDTEDSSNVLALDPLFESYESGPPTRELFHTLDSSQNTSLFSSSDASLGEESAAAADGTEKAVSNTATESPKESSRFPLISSKLMNGKFFPRASKKIKEKVAKPISPAILPPTLPTSKPQPTPTPSISKETSDAARAISMIEKILSSGFYYSYDTDISHTLQQKWEQKLPGGFQGPPGYTVLDNDTSVCLLDITEPNYWWNEWMCTPFLEARVDKRWLIPIFQGYVGYERFERGDEQYVEIALICRKSKRHVGTRFNSRGIDDEAYVANFAEIEQLARCDVYPYWASLVQIRGSVPLFWEQQSVTSSVVLTRPPELGTLAFQKHIRRLREAYGPNLILLDLLSQSRGVEANLVRALHEQIALNQKEYPEEEHIPHFQFDMHNEVKTQGFDEAMGNTLHHTLKDTIRSVGYFLGATEDQALRTQQGVIRTHCLDCLDRTNLFQWNGFITVDDGIRSYCWSWMSSFLEFQGYNCNHLGFERQRQLLNQINAQNAYSEDGFYAPSPRASSQNMGGYLETEVNAFSNDRGGIPGAATLPTATSSVEGREDAAAEEIRDFRTHFNRLWAGMGDAVSFQYTGTASLFSSQIKKGKVSMSTNWDQAWKSLNRLYQSNVMDSLRQECLDILTGVHFSCVVIPTIEDYRLKQYGVIGSLDEATNYDARIQKEQEDTATASKSEKVLQYLAECQFRNIRVWCGTWNVAGQELHELDHMEKWLFPALEQSDVYVFGIQELVELTGIRILMNMKDNEKEVLIEEKIHAALKKIPNHYKNTECGSTYGGPQFVKVHSIGMLGLYITIYARNGLKDLISGIDSVYVKGGLKGNRGNKGATGIRFSIGYSSFCFINVHLASGTGEAVDSERFQQLNQITQQHFQSSRRSGGIFDHDYLVMLGDFNYRIGKSFNAVAQHLRSSDYGPLWSSDPLKWYLSNKIAPFQNFLEGKLSFPPTYKYKRLTCVYDSQRVPSWCDRILYQLRNPTGDAWNPHSLYLLNYSSHQDFVSSDHKPVSSCFQLNVILGKLDGKGTDDITKKTALEIPEHQATVSNSTALLKLDDKQTDNHSDATLSYFDENKVAFGDAQPTNFSSSSSFLVEETVSGNRINTNIDSIFSSNDFDGGPTNHDENFLSV